MNLKWDMWVVFQEQKRLELGQMETQIQYNEALIDERDQGIAEISQQIGEVNEIFQARTCLVYYNAALSSL